MSDTTHPKDNVTKFPKRSKQPVEQDDRFLTIKTDGCQHLRGYILNHKEACVTCKECGVKLDPLSVLKQMAIQETSWHRSRQAFIDEMKVLNERRRCKCDHCGQMTRIPTR